MHYSSSSKRVLIAVLGLIVVILCLSSGPLFANAQKTGAKTALASAGINHVISQTLPLILQQAESSQIPPVSGETGTAIGKIEYELSNIQLSSLNIGSFTVQSSSNSVVTVVISGVSLQLNLDWHYKVKTWPKPSDHGRATASTSGSTIVVDVAVGISNGRPTVSVQNVQVSLSDFNLDFHGGASWLYNALEGIFNDQIKNAAQSNVASAIQQAINQQASSALSSLNLIQKVDDVSEISFALTSQSFTDSYMSFGCVGEFYSIANPAEAPFSPVPLPDAVNGDMVQIILSEFVIMSASYVYTEAGFLQYLITPDMVPSSIPFHLNTTSLRFLLPSLYAAYPNRAVQIQLEATTYPVVDITVANGISATIVGNFIVQVLDPTPVTAFVLGVNIATDGVVSVEDATTTTPLVTGQLKYLNFTMSLQSSNVGPVNTVILNTLAELIVKAIVNEINTKIAKGFAIPSIQGATLVNPTVSLYDGFIAITSDINYNPSTIQSKHEQDEDADEKKDEDKENNNNHHHHHRRRRHNNKHKKLVRF